MDGEESPPRNGLDDVLRDGDLRAAWARYHLIADVLAENLPRHMDPGFGDRVRAAVDVEPALLAPNALRYRWRKPVAAVAIAASVAVVAVISAQRLNAPRPTPAPIATAERAAIETTPAVWEGNAAPVQSAGWHVPGDPAASRLNSYLVNHSEHRSSIGVPAMSPYVRIVGYEAGQ
jgi:negative regulator of sigma E activity